MKCDECKQEKEIKINNLTNFDIICPDCTEKIKEENKKMRKYLHRKLSKEKYRKKRYKSFIEKELSKRKAIQ